MNSKTHHALVTLFYRDLLLVCILNLENKLDTLLYEKRIRWKREKKVNVSKVGHEEVFIFIYSFTHLNRGHKSLGHCTGSTACHEILKEPTSNRIGG